MNFHTLLLYPKQRCTSFLVCFAFVKDPHAAVHKCWAFKCAVATLHGGYGAPFLCNIVRQKQKQACWTNQREFRGACVVGRLLDKSTRRLIFVEASDL